MAFASFYASWVLCLVFQTFLKVKITNKILKIQILG